MIISIYVQYIDFIAGASGTCVCYNAIGCIDQHDGGWVSNYTECFKKCCINHAYTSFGFLKEDSQLPGAGLAYSCRETEKFLSKEGYTPEDFRTPTTPLCSIQ